MPGWIVLQNRPGTPYQLSGRTITPFALSLVVNIPGTPAGFIYNHPTSIHIQSEDGQEKVVPVPDVTLQVLLTLAGMTLVSALVIGVMHRQK